MLALFLATVLSTQARRPISLSKSENGIGCDLCKNLVKQIEALLLDGKTEKEVADWVAGQCTFFTEPLLSVCTKIAEQYVPIIMQLIEKELEHHEICQIIGFCDSQSVGIRKGIADNSVGCDVCVKVVTYVEELLLNKLVEAEVAKLVSTLCYKFPAPGSTYCQIIVQKYIPVVMQWIEKKMEKVPICEKLGFCKELPKIEAPKNGMGCTVCKEVISYIEKAMVSTKVEEEIEAIVGKLCVKFPAPYNTLCESLVKQYIPVIMQWLEEGLEHLEICSKLGFCEETKAPRIPMNLGSYTPNGMGCDLCKQVVTYIEKEMVSTKVEEEIEKVVIKICAKFPAPYNTLCESLVKQYVPIIMEWLEQGLEHSEICSKLGFCEAQKKARLPINEQNGINCDVCQSFFKWAEGELEHYTVAYLWKLVHEKCPSVPYLRQFCLLINEQNIETFVQLLLSKAPPQKLCEWIHIC